MYSVKPRLDHAVIRVLSGYTAGKLDARVLTQEHLINPRAVSKFLSSHFAIQAPERQRWGAYRSEVKGEPAGRRTRTEV